MKFQYFVLAASLVTANLISRVAFAQISSIATIPVQGNATSVAAADLDGDSFVDVVASTYLGYTVLMGSRSGSLGSPSAIVNIGSGTVEGIALADMDNDGRADLIGAGDPGAVFVARGTGAGAFFLPTFYGSGANNPVRVLDVSGDGKLDVVVPIGNSIEVYTGKGDGTLDLAPLTFATVGSSTGLAAGDINNDGYLDALTCDANHDRVSILLGSSAGTFAPYYTVNVDHLPGDVALGDFNEDGTSDLVVTSTFNHNVGLRIGDGTGQFSPLVTYPVVNGPSELALADYNSDGNLDIAVPNSFPNGAGQWVASILLGDGAGGLMPKTDFQIGALARGMVAANLNEDAIPDLITANFNGQSITVLLANAPANGLSTYGIGKAGCTGPELLFATSNPFVGNSQFGIVVDHVQPLSKGLLLITDKADLLGSDPFNVGIPLYVDVLHANQLVSADAFADTHGKAVIHAAIPKTPALVGSKYYAQEVWSWAFGSCQPNVFPFPYGLSATNGLEVTILP